MEADDKPTEKPGIVPRDGAIAKDLPPRAVPPLDARWFAILVGSKLLLHLALGGRYGYFRDELYYLDAGRHLAWGYVDFAPLVALYAKISLLLGGQVENAVQIGLNAFVEA